NIGGGCMKAAFKTLFTLLVLALLTACGAVPKIDSDAAKLTSIKTVGVIRGPVPKAYSVANFGHPGMAFGLVGGLVAAADMESKQKELAAAYEKVGPATEHNTLAAQV